MESPGNDWYSRLNGKLGQRHLQCLLYFLSMVITYVCETSIAHTFKAITGELSYENPMSLGSRRTLGLWPACTYTVMLIPFGYLVTIWSAKMILTINILMSGIITVLFPILFDRMDFIYLLPYDVFWGFSSASYLTCLYTLLSKWVPPNERGRFGTITYTGPRLGIEISGLIFKSLINPVAWRHVCYIFGAVAVVWSLIFLILGSDSPAASSSAENTFSRISKAERSYIESSLREGEREITSGGKKNLRIPWKAIFTSRPFWVVLIVHCTHECGSLIVGSWKYRFTRIPAPGDKEKQYEWMSPITILLLSITIGWLFDVMIEGGLSRGLARKISNTIGHWGSGLVVIGMIFVSKNTETTTIALVAVILADLNIGTICGFQINHIDLSTNYAGVLIAFTSTAASVVSLVTNWMITKFLYHWYQPESWTTVLIITAGIFFLGNVFFILWGSGETQSWNNRKPLKDRILLRTLACDNLYV